MALDGSDSDDVSIEGSEHRPCSVDLNSVPVMIGDNRTQFERVVEHEDIQCPLNEEDIIAARRM